MWIQDADKGLVNLHLTGQIFVDKKNTWNDEDSTFAVKAYTGSSPDASSLYSFLYVGDQDKCIAYLERLTAKLQEAHQLLIV